MNSETNKGTIEAILRIAADIQHLQPEDRLTQMVQAVQEDLKDYNEALDNDGLKNVAGGTKGPYVNPLKK